MPSYRFGWRSRTGCRSSAGSWFPIWWIEAAAPRVEARQERLVELRSQIVHGDRKPCLVALVTLDPSGWRDWCEARDIAVGLLSDAVSDGRVRLEVACSIGAGNTRLSRAEQVKNWALLDAEWTSKSGELTPTMKLRCPVIVERYRDEIEQHYDPLPSDW